MHDSISKKMQKEPTIFNEKMFYGHQTNKFPVRQDNRKDLINEEIER
jgi:hypothetical protein